MEDESEYTKEQGMWAFTKSVWFHWENIGSIAFGGASVTFAGYLGWVAIGGVSGLIAALCFFVACHRAWRKERLEKEKAIAALIPPIAGTWTREAYSNGIIGVQKFYFDGKTLTGTFTEGNLDHDVDGTYDPETRCFTTIVKRTDFRDDNVGRHQEEVKYWLVGKDMYYYYASKNANGVEDRGFLYRQGTNPPWSGPRR